MRASTSYSLPDKEPQSQPQSPPQVGDATPNSQPSMDDAPETFPDGGVRAWSVVLGSWCAFLPTFGLMNTTGVFTDWLATDQLQGYTRSDVSWIFSLYMFFLWFEGVQVGPIFDRYGPRYLVSAGTVGLTVAVMMFSVSKEYYQFILSFGCLGGISASMLASPSISIINHWFYRRRALATGLAVTSGGIGGIIMPQIFNALAPKAGFGWAVRTLGFIALFFCSVASILQRKRLGPNYSSRKTVDLRVLGERGFGVTALAIIFADIAATIPLTYLTSYARAKGMSVGQSYTLMSILNATSIVGRLMPGYAADRYGRFNTMVVTTSASTILTLALWLCAGTNHAAIIAYAALFGFWSGSAISLSPVCVAQISKTEDFGKRYGTAYTLVALGVLVALPVAGQILEGQSSGSEQVYWGLIVFTGVAPGDITHQAISSYFIGPEAENIDEFKTNIATVLSELEKARKRYFPQPPDKKFIPPEVKSSAEFQRLTGKFRETLGNAARLLGEKSVPFWSPRYQAHMCTDVSMVALIGYFMTMLYNPNNVAIEASPFSTAAEILVGEQLCELFGFNTQKGAQDLPTGWAHVTCGGTVANLESIWVGEFVSIPSGNIEVESVRLIEHEIREARNLMFYPLSLLLAIKEGQLQFAREDFPVKTCAGIEKNFADLSTWELLNLKAETVLDLPKMLYDRYGVSPTFIEQALDKYNIQTTSKGKLEEAFGIKKPCRYLLTNTRHYSWPKGGAVAGIGSENMVGVQVDAEARVDLVDLVSKLEQCLREEQAVYAVVAVVGSTEEGAVDRLSEILRIRQRFQKRGLSFLVHADAAWGEYFASMLPRKLMRQEEPLKGATSDQGFVPDLGLKVETQEDLLAIRFADSVTVDPHKAGYIPYPAGALAYRDERLRSLVTWTSPYIGRGSLTNIGIYGVEGSKPGAAAMATWLANECIGLNQNGYGALLSEATFTSTRLAAHWAAMTTKEDSFICVALNRLPAEVNGGDIEGQKKFIREQVLHKSNQEIVANDESTHTMTLLRALGSDLNINAFSLNWRYEDGRLNDDIEEANYLMVRVVKELSISSPNDEPAKMDFFLTSTEFKHEEYGNCAELFMDRLGIARSKQNLMVLRNVVMSAFPTEHELINQLVTRFRAVVEDAVKVCRDRNAIRADIHRFYIQGTADTYFIYRPRFQEARFRRQLILKGRFDQTGFQAYVKAKARGVVYLNTSDETCLETLLNEVNNNGEATFQGNLVNRNGTILSNVSATLTQIIKNRSLNARNREPNYPATYMPFYLYGSNSQPHISHVLLKSPNIELGAANVQLALDPNTTLEDDELARGAILCLTDTPEAPMQPFLGVDVDSTNDFFFRPGQKFKAKIWRDLKRAEESGPKLLPTELEGFGPELASGEVLLRSEVLVDAEAVNRDPFGDLTGDEASEAWRELFKSLEGLKQKAGSSTGVGGITGYIMLRIVGVR
ncbi:uncharacterized protein BDV17DRAFT_295795 [Aspergillus undulatus]|uniref:uncharacterized protein n=1 Tax=Aspergillus undulatus TaxID=1810928 RepID=UPI003CCCA1C1